ncbi:PREDICTED: uncharacterized protein LOC108617213 [Drosophila arizonae]|uniref:Uncharacterized protein LOC108617213 n=1 Tax=Drosophila arizonae TaxID=7263 RepID=A0ABM1PMI8_DROAR|nr:PREDICTED: uncharacterized protein LOC108617213 [Drosophila arizonae]
MKYILFFLDCLILSLACNPKLPAALRDQAARTCLPLGFSNILNYRCFPYCFMNNMGFFINGQISRDTVLLIMAPIAGLEKVKAAQAKCDIERSREKKCDFAVKLSKCYEDNDVIIFDDLSFLYSDLVTSYFNKTNSTK